MERNKLHYESPRTESIELRFEGIICQSDPIDTYGNPSYNGFSRNEEEW